MSLKKRKKTLLIGFSIVFCTIALAAIASIVTINHIIKSENERAFSEETQLIGHIIDTWLLDRINILSLYQNQAVIHSALNRKGTIQKKAQARSSELLTELITNNGSYDNLFLVNTIGSVIASSHSNDIGVNIRDKDVFIRAMAGKKNIANLSTSESKGELNKIKLFLALPIYGNNQKITGAIVASIPLQALNKVIFGKFEPKNSEGLYLIDDLGSIISFKSAEKEVIDISDANIPYNVMNGNNGFYWEGKLGKDNMLSFVKLGFNNWRLVFLKTLSYNKQWKLILTLVLFCLGIIISFISYFIFSHISSKKS